jgi:hypothetical protein
MNRSRILTKKHAIDIDNKGQNVKLIYTYKTTEFDSYEKTSPTTGHPLVILRGHSYFNEVFYVTQYDRLKKDLYVIEKDLYVRSDD